MLLSLLFIGSAAYAERALAGAAITEVGTITVKVKKNTPQGAVEGGKNDTVELLDLKLSDEAKAALKARVDAMTKSPKSIPQGAFPEMSLPASKSLGMGHVPILDQGRHGSCVTFAVTGALDVAMGKGNEISQLCSLSVGRYLQEHGWQCCSGWHGSYGSTVLRQITQYGYMTQSQQMIYGCGGLRMYPSLDGDNEGKPMELSTFSRYRSFLPGAVYYTKVASLNESLKSGALDPESILRAVKQSIASNQRVVFGVLIDTDAPNYGLVWHRMPYDSWAMSDKIADDVRRGRVHAGHEMIITGYDDNASIAGQRGVLTIRNSWGSLAGDGGTYYMSYEYFILMSLDAQAIHSK